MMSHANVAMTRWTGGGMWIGILIDVLVVLHGRADDQVN